MRSTKDARGNVKFGTRLKHGPVLEVAGVSPSRRWVLVPASRTHLEA